MFYVLIMIVALMNIGLLGFYGAHIYYTERLLKMRKISVEHAPTYMLEDELNKRKALRASAYR